jgi:hypothetical protein
MVQQQIPASQLADRVRRHQLLIGCDNVGGALNSQQIGVPEVSFSGTPTNYGRASGIMPADYAGGTIAVKVYLWSGSAGNNQAMNYYIADWRDASSLAGGTWNVQSNQTTGATIGLAINTMKAFTLYTIPAGTVQAGDYIAMAMRPNAAVTGTIVYAACWLEYTAEN